MDLVFSVNSASQDIRWGDPAAGALGTITPLGFACVRLAVFPGQRHVYITGSRDAGGVPHAWLAVLDTCSGLVVKELDLGVGFAGQTAVPGGIGGIRAYVAISRAVGQVDTGAQGGSNRIAVLNTANPADPILLNPAINIPGSAFGTLHIVWSIVRNTLYTTHRGDSALYSIDPMAGVATLLTALTDQPTGMALSRNQLVLYVGRRVAGEISVLDISGPVLGSLPPLLLPNGRSNSAIYLAVDGQDRVVATSAQRASTPTEPNPNPVPAPGIVYIFDPASANPLVPAQVDVQGSWLGQPAVAPDSSRVYVPRGDQSDLAEIDLAAQQVNGLIGVGHSPTDATALNHLAGETLTVTPNPAVTTCDAPIEVTVRAFDACGNEQIGVPVRPTTFASNVNIVNVVRNTPATYEVQCTGNGPETINFSTWQVFPFVSVNLDVNCECLTNYCIDFSNFAGGPLPGVGGTLGILQVSVLVPGVFQGIQIFGNEMYMRGGTVRFRMPAGVTVNDLTIKYTRHDSLSQPELAVITHAAGTDSVSNPAVGLLRGDHELPCLFRGIREWTFAAGAESRIRELCFRAQPGLVFM